jgi:Fic family protein
MQVSENCPAHQLLNDVTGEIIYTPPQDYNTIVRLMNELEKFINDDTVLRADELVKMAIIHHRFETILPSMMEMEEPAG